MGLTSLVLRAPAVAISHAAGASGFSQYRVGAIVCLVAAICITVALARTALVRGAAPAAVALLAAVWFYVTVWSRAVFFGHPEEPLAAALACAAIVLAAGRRPVAAGLVIGLAIGTKEWALLALPAAVFAGSPAAWRQTLAAAAVAVALTTGVMAVGNPHSFKAAHQAQARGDLHAVTPASAWFRLGTPQPVGRAGAGTDVRPPKAIGRWCRPLVILVGLLASLLYWLRRGFCARDAFALVAFVLVLRVILDTQTYSYHLVPMLMALAAWEVLGRRRLPIAAIAATLAFAVTVRVIVPNYSPEVFNTTYLIWTGVLAVYLGFRAFTRERRAAVTGR